MKKLFLAVLIACVASPAVAHAHASPPVDFSFDIFEWISSIFESQQHDEESQVVKSDGTIYDSAVKSDGTVYDAVVKSDGIVYD